MAFYHTVPTYLSNYSQVTKIGDPRGPADANPRGLGPAPPSAYKRAVLRNPPKQFSVSVLPTKKLGSGWVYGLHITSTIDEEGPDRNSVSSRSTSSRRSYKDYEVWRRWDDCLWFQESLELEYSIQAREKRRRLEQGKGVKKNGVYIDSKRAASFESLPPGPDPNSVSLDLHHHIPKLTKKSSLFRANQATLDLRQQQFVGFINAWFAPGLPVLVAELRDSNAFRDFFGWWRRDKDFKQKYGPGKGKGPETPTFGSVPFYLDASNSSEFFPSSTNVSPTSPPSRSKPTRASTADAITQVSRRNGSNGRSREDASSRRRRTTSDTSSSPTVAVSYPSILASQESRPSSRASLYSALSSELSPTVVMWDGHQQLSASDRVSPGSDAFPQTPMVRETFENLQYPPSPEPDSPVLGGLEDLPEELELDHHLSQFQLSLEDREPGTPSPVARSNNGNSDNRHRNGVAFSGIVLDVPEISEIPKGSPTMSNITGVSSRHSLFSDASMVPSWRTSASDLIPCPSPRRSLESCTTDTVDCSSSGSPVSPQTPWCSDDGETLPTPGLPIKRNPRDSVWSINSIVSINSVMSDCSVDQVLPRVRRRHRSRKFAPMSAQGERAYLEDCDEDILESYLYGIEEMDASAESESDDFVRYQEPPPQRPTPDPHPDSFQNPPPKQFRSPARVASPPISHSHSPSEDTSESLIGRISLSSTSTVSLKSISIKAYMTEDTIIVFRTPIETKYAEIRDKIYDKFVNQEGITLRRDFPLAYLTPVRPHSATSSVYSGINRNRAVSVGNASAQSSLVCIQSQEQWEEILGESDGKLTLRVFE